MLPVLGLGILVGIVLSTAFVQLRKVLRKRKALRKYAEWKQIMEAASSPWSWDKELTGWDYVEPTDSPKFKPIVHP